jgi:hypothetical protein
MPEIPQAEQRQIIDHLADAIKAITALSGVPVAIEYARGEAGLVIKANGGPYKQKTYVNGPAGDFVGEFSFMVLNTVEQSDGVDSVLDGTAPLLTIADYFDTLNIATLDIGERKPVKIEMTSRPQDMAGVQENGTITFFAVYTLTYRKKGA